MFFNSNKFLGAYLFIKKSFLKLNQDFVVYNFLYHNFSKKFTSLFLKVQ